jgi:hypothetical protein
MVLKVGWSLMGEVAHQGFHCIMYSVNCAIGVGLEQKSAL